MGTTIFYTLNISFELITLVIVVSIGLILKKDKKIVVQ